MVPRPVDDYTTSRVLTMEYVGGSRSPTSRRSRALEIGRTGAGRRCCARPTSTRSWMDGFFHADPHPGNVLITEDGRLALLDLGMVARLEPTMQEQLLKLLLAVTEGQGAGGRPDRAPDGTRLEGCRRGALPARGGRPRGELPRRPACEQIQMGRPSSMLARLAAENGVRPAAGADDDGQDALLQLDESPAPSTPDSIPTGSCGATAMDHAPPHAEEASPASASPAALEMQDFLQHLPGR